MKHFLFIALTLVMFESVRLAEIQLCEGVTDGVFLPDPTNCSNYITCMKEKAYPGSCSDGLFFSAKTQRCDTAEKTQCFPKCGNDLDFFNYDKTCTKYVVCYAATPVAMQCADDLQYNEQTNRCDFPRNVDCQANMCTGINDPKNIHFVPSHASCEKYYMCYNGEAVQQQCSPGLMYNHEVKGCDYKEHVNCTISAKSRNVLPYAKMPPIRANIPCPKNGSHFYPNPSNKSSYYFCSNGKGITLTCSPGLVYDRTIELCRDPKNVKK